MKDRIKVINGDCLVVMKEMIDGGEPLYDSLVVDPPYHLASIVKRFGKEKSAAKSQMGSATTKKQPEKRGAQFKRLSRGFMGKEWDGGDVAFQKETWELAFQLLKPGAHLAAFAASRNVHRMAVAIEDAGFEIRDQLQWIYGTGFPKSKDIEKEVLKTNFDRASEFHGWGTALKPCFEPIVLARKPLVGTLAKNALDHGVGGLNIDACRVGRKKGDRTEYGRDKPLPKDNKVFGKYKAASYTPDEAGRWPGNVITDGSFEVVARFPIGATRFFYSAKASAAEKINRDDSHPTVKPVDLMAWLCKLITPPGGRVLDIFGGTGSTGIGGALEGFNVTLIERDPAYYKDILTRIERGGGEDLPLISGEPEQSEMF